MAQKRNVECDAQGGQVLQMSIIVLHRCGRAVITQSVKLAPARACLPVLSSGLGIHSHGRREAMVKKPKAEIIQMYPEMSWR